MKKFICTMLAAALVGLSAFAAAPERKYELTFGPAYTWSESAHMQSLNGLSSATNIKLSFQDDMGLYVGFFLPISKNLGFYPGLTANWDGKFWRDGQSYNQITFKTYALDLDARYNFNFNSGTFYLMGGPTITFLPEGQRLSANVGVGLNFKLFSSDAFRLTFEGKYRVNPSTFSYTDVKGGDYESARPETWTAFTGLTFKF